MRRVLSSLRWETTLQHRHGFYYVTTMVVAIMAGLLTQVPDPSIPPLMPAFFVNALFITTFYFFAALVLLEKADGTLEGLVVTPLRSTEYLAVKVIALSALALAENLLILLIGYGQGFSAAWLALGLIGMSVLYSLAGFIAVVRFDAINDFVLPSLGIMLLLALPLIDHFGWWRSVLWYLHPLQPALVLMRAAFTPVPIWQIAYGLVGSTTWTAVAFVWAGRLFDRFLVRAVGS